MASSNLPGGPAEGITYVPRRACEQKENGKHHDAFEVGDKISLPRSALPSTFGFFRQMAVKQSV